MAVLCFLNVLLLTTPLFAATSTDELLVKIDALREQIAYHDDLYFREAAPELTDFEYDLLKLELRRLENEAGVASGIGEIGDDRSDESDQINHGRPMLSLNKAYSDADVNEFFRRVSGIKTAGEIKFSIEPKFDGVAVSVRLHRGELVSAATRGNGATGEDITAAVGAIRGLRYEWEFDPLHPRIESIELRGEIYLADAEFARLNRERTEAGEASFRHPRSVAAGSIKLTDLREISARGLSMVFHGWGEVRPAEAAPDSIKEFQRWLESRGLPAVESARFVTPIDGAELNSAVSDLRSKLVGFPTDGVVIKVNSIDLQNEIGVGPTAPRWALARKFSPPRAETILRNIVWQVGRTGALTPVAEFDPVVLGGATIRRASLSNPREIRQRDLRLGDTVWVEKAGEIIPQIAGLLIDRRPSTASVYELPLYCPSCDKELLAIPDDRQLTCVNFDCPEQVVQRLIHFVSKGALDIKGVGPVMAKRLVDAGLVGCPSDLYLLTSDQLVALPRVGEKTAQRLLGEIEKSRSASLPRWLTALGLPGVGPSSADVLAEELSDLSDLLSESSYRDAISVLGDSSAAALEAYLARPVVRSSLTRLVAALSESP